MGMEKIQSIQNSVIENEDNSLLDYKNGIMDELLGVAEDEIEVIDNRFDVFADLLGNLFEKYIDKISLSCLSNEVTHNLMKQEESN